MIWLVKNEPYYIKFYSSYWFLYDFIMKMGDLMSIDVRENIQHFLSIKKNLLVQKKIIFRKLK